MPPPRNVADATRFAQNVRNPPPRGGETAQQRVARIREANRRAKANNITTFDRVVHYGRIWADRLHRGFVFGIIGFSAVTAALLGYTTWDILRHASRNKKEFREHLAVERVKGLAAWRSKEIERLVGLGLDEETAMRAFDETEQKRIESKSAWGRLKTWASGGLTPAEEEYSSKYELQESRIKSQVIERLQAEHLQILLAQKAAEAQRTNGETTEQSTSDPSSATTTAATATPSTSSSQSESQLEPRTSSWPSEVVDKAEAVANVAEKQAKSQWNSISGWFKGKDPK